MAYIYNVEPNTDGKVVLHTSAGDLEIELWPKQAPLACRNFVQLCLEGYYNGTIFHRVIKDMMIQGGDPSGSGQGGESIWEKAFKDEISSRLRFSHRGLVAMANENKPNTNHSQFFITLNKTEYLNGKHTIFGKVVGNTVYNLAHIGEMETDEEDRPVYPTTIKSTTVVSNPFDDIIPRVVPEEPEMDNQPQSSSKKRIQSSAAIKNTSVMSFAGSDSESSSDDNDDDNNGKRGRKSKSTEQSSQPTTDWLSLFQPKPSEENPSGNTDATSNSMEIEPHDQVANTQPMSESEKMKERVKQRMNEARERSAQFPRSQPIQVPIERPSETVLTKSEYNRQRYLRRKEVTADRTKETLKALDSFQATLKDAWLDSEQQKPPSHTGKDNTGMNELQTSESKENTTQVESSNESPNEALTEAQIENILNIGDGGDDDDDDDVSDPKRWMTSQLKFSRHIDDEYRVKNYQSQVNDHSKENEYHSRDRDDSSRKRKDVTRDRDRESKHHRH